MANPKQESINIDPNLAAMEFAGRNRPESIG